MARFENKIVLITGATSGIGKETAIQAALEGAYIIAIGRNEKRGNEVIDVLKDTGAKAKFYQCDVAKSNQVKELFQNLQKEYGHIDVAINCAGVVGPSETVEEISDESWASVIDANLNSTFYTTREEVQLMKQKGGAIVNMGSVAGIRGFPSAAAYVASKHAVVGLTKAIAFDYAPYNIRCNAICPATTDTPLTKRSEAAIQEKMEQLTKEGKDPQEWLKRSMLAGKTETLQKRNATAKEQAMTILYFASDDASHITGSIVASDGGFSSY